MTLLPIMVKAASFSDPGFLDRPAVPLRFQGAIKIGSCRSKGFPLNQLAQNPYPPGFDCVCT